MIGSPAGFAAWPGAFSGGFMQAISDAVTLYVGLAVQLAISMAPVLIACAAGWGLLSKLGSAVNGNNRQ